MWPKKINTAIETALDQLNLEKVDFNIERPKEESHGDYSSNVAMVLFPHQTHYPNPRALAEAIKDQIQNVSKDLGHVASINVAGPGFINFTLTTKTHLEVLEEIIKKGETYGCNHSLQEEKIVVEFTDPNPFKELHIGHIYSNAVGESIARLLESSGATVWRADYYGDIGLHVAKSIWGMQQLLKEKDTTIESFKDLDIVVRQRFLGECYAYGSTQYESDPKAKETITILNTHLYAVAQEVMIESEGATKKIDFESFIQEPKRFDRQELKKLYTLGKAWSLEYFETVYARLGTKFDGYYPESTVSEVGYEYVMNNIENGIFEKSNEAIVFPGEKYGLHTRVFINKNSLPTYEAKELGLAPSKYKDFPYTKSVIVTGNEINEYFKVLITALKQINPSLGNITTHIGHGMVRLPEGKMSSRTGKVITGDSLVNEAQKRALKIIEDINPTLENKQVVADQIGIAAIKFAFLKSNVGGDIVFNFDDALSFTGMSGPYIQYTYARCKSVIQKANINLNSTAPFDPNLQEMSILAWLSRFEETVIHGASEYAPHTICQYVYELAGRFNTFYNSYSILGNNDNVLDENLKMNRLKLTIATAIVLQNGLKMLGIQSPEKM